MMTVALSLDGTSQSAVQLEQDNIYRIGRRLGLEFHSYDESVKLAHATVTLIVGGIVRIAAVAGKVFVNGREIEIKSISNSDIVNGSVDLRFGNVNAKLYFNDAKPLDNDAFQAHDSSGYEEGIKDKSNNATGDSLFIPESRPPSADTTCEEESFNIPETQAISFTTRRPRTREESIFSLGDDIQIPETQDVPLYSKKPAKVHHVQRAQQRVSSGNDFVIPETQDFLDEDDASELGTQIRICTQDFNQCDEDAIDDFDSSLLLGDVALSIFPKGNPNHSAEDIGLDHDMSALNWSTSISKCTAFNSTKADDEICLLPNLSATGEEGLDLDDVPCTPDIYHCLETDALQSSGSQEPELINVNVDVHSRSSNQNNAGCTADQPLVTSVDTPETTPASPEDNIATQMFLKPKPVQTDGSTHNGDYHIEDFIETQVFQTPLSKSKTSCDSFNDEDNEDFIETQAFPKRKPFLTSTSQSSSSKDEDNEDFIETQAFPKGKPFLTSSSQSNTSSTSTKDEDNEDFIETQAFPKLKSCTFNEDNEDFIETQAFPKSKSLLAPQLTSELSSSSKKRNDNKKSFVESKRNETRSNSQNCAAKLITKANAIKDLKETQMFTSHSKTVLDQNECERLQIPDSISIDDELDEELKQLIALSAIPSSPSDDGSHSTKNLIKANYISNKKQEKKTSQSKETIKESKRQEGRTRSAQKRLALRSESPESSPCKLRRTRKVSEPITPTAAKIAHGKMSKVLKVESIMSPKRTRSRTRSQDIKSVDAEGSSDPVIKDTMENRTVDSCQKLVVKVKKSRVSKDEANATIEVEQQPVAQRQTKKNTQKPAIVIISDIKIRDAHLNEKDSGTSTVPAALITPAKYSEKPKAEASTSSKMVDIEKSFKGKISKEEDNATIAEGQQPVIQRQTRKNTQKPNAAIVKDAHSNDKDSGTSKVPAVFITPAKSTEKPKPGASASSSMVDIEKSPKGNIPKKGDNAAIAVEQQPVKQRQTRKNTQKPNASDIKTKDAHLNDKDSSTSKAPEALITRAKNTRKPKAEATTNSKVVDIEGAPKDKPKQSSKPSEESSDEKPTSHTKRTKDSRRGKLPNQDPLQDINDYLKKIRSSGRKFQIALSMCNYAELQRILKSLKHVVEVTEDPKCCDLLLMDTGERTFKFLVSVASNKPILTTSWLHSIKETRSIVANLDHMLKDGKFKDVFCFNPLLVLEHPSLFKGLHFMLGNTIQPNIKDMKVIIESADGTVHSKPPPIGSNVHLYVVATRQDKYIFKQLEKYANLQFILTEGVMQALVQHKVELLDQFQFKI